MMGVFLRWIAILFFLIGFADFILGITEPDLFTFGAGIAFMLPYLIMKYREGKREANDS